MPRPAERALKPAEDAKRLSPWIRPLMWAYRLVAGDSRQVASWSRRVEQIEQDADIAAEPSTDGKAILERVEAWRQMKSAGALGAAGGMGMAVAWSSWLVPLYAIPHGFGWLAASSLLLPLPTGWHVGKKLWEKASLQGMKELGSSPTATQQLRAVSGGLIRGMSAGAGMGFTIVFLQMLITWFMTPAPTLFLELIADLQTGMVGAAVGASVGALLGPVVSRSVPEALPAPSMPLLED